jgi:hypothetical protein
MNKVKNISVSFKPTLLALALMASFQTMAEITPTSDVSQIVTNIAPVFNTSNIPVVVSADGSSSTFNPLNLQAGSTVSVTATGAAASVSVSAVNSAFMAPVSGIGNVIQNVSNSSTTPPVVVGGPTGVNNYYLSGEDSSPLIVQLGASSSATLGGLIGIGASVSIAATGAVASVSVSGISADPSITILSLPTIGSISQYVPGSFQAGVINSATVTNIGTINTIGNMNPGASASISASGAVASVGVSILAADGTNTGGTSASVAPITTTAASIGQIGQFVVNTNTANVTNTGIVTMATPFSSSESLLLDAGSTVSISATGAAAAVSVSMINSSLTSQGWTVGPVVQVADNSALVTNSGTVSASVNGSSGATLPALGRGASVSIGATGAAASFSISAISDNTPSNVTLPTSIGGTFSDSSTPTPYSAGISQGVQNTAQISNTGSITSLGSLGAGASASVSATGAVASIGFSSNGGDMVSLGSVPTNIQGVGQVANNLLPSLDTNYYIQNTGTITTGNLGNGASVSVGSTGAVASLNVSAIDGGMGSLNITPSGNNPVSLIPAGSNPVAPSTLAVYQGAQNNRAITNVGTVTTGDLALGASASISASAAVSSMSFSVINGEASGSAIGTAGTPSIEQRSYNTGNVFNTTQATSPAAAMLVGSLGNGASASISASGAVTSTSVNFNNSNFNPTGQAFSFGDIQQYSTNNTAQIINAGSVSGATPILLSVGSLPGTGASASISASGAVASVSYSSIAGQETAGTYLWNQSFGAVNQTALNQNEAPPTGVNIINNGVITIGGLLTGVNSSASVGSTGAATSFAVSSVTDPVLTNTLATGPITQVASNAGVINNTGTITFTGANPATLGVGSSVSVSATGAVSSVSYRSVNTVSTK